MLTGGRETWIANIANRLADCELGVRVVAMRGRRSMKASLYRLSAKISLLNLPTLSSMGPVGIPILREVDMALFSFFAFISLLRLRKGTFVLCMNAGLETFAGLLLRLVNSNIRVIVSVRGQWASEMSLAYPKVLRPLAAAVLLALERCTLQSADLVIANGVDTLQYLASITSRHATVVPNGVDFQRFSSHIQETEERQVRIASVATLRDVKGISHLIASAPLIRDELQRPFKIVFIGKGRKARYEQLVRRMHLEKLIEFVGERTDIDEVLAQAHIVVCVSGGTGLSHSLLEAMAAGKAIVAWDRPTYTQILEHERNALLAREWDVFSLSREIVRLCRDSGLRKGLGFQARIDARQFDWSKVVSKLIESIWQSV